VCCYHISSKLSEIFSGQSIGHESYKMWKKVFQKAIYSSQVRFAAIENNEANAVNDETFIF